MKKVTFTLTFENVPQTMLNVLAALKISEIEAPVTLNFEEENNSDTFATICAIIKTESMRELISGAVKKAVDEIQIENPY
jgi:acyl-coenzyme A synthetase/AMP-(fatty) acid ligase